MSSAVYFKFKASLKQYTIPFEGSAISVKDLRNAIRLSCGLKSTDFELQILDKQGKEFSKEDDLIPKFSDLIVRRLPKANDPPKKKIANPEDMTRRDPYKAINLLPKINLYGNSINLAKSNIPDDEKLDIMTKRCSEEYSEKNYLVKPKPYGVPPASYVCNKCHQGGHWIHECPGLRDRDGKLLDFKSVKRPTGIPQDFLLEVAPGTPGAYLTKEGKYMVPIKDAEAYALGKKEKRPFSIEENPPYIVKDEELPSKLKCLLCNKLLENPTSTPCCSSVFCVKCISDYLYDPEVNGSRQCPSCLSIIEHHESLIDNELLRQLIQCWKANMLTKEIVDSCLLTTINHNHSSSLTPSTSMSSLTGQSATQDPRNKKTELNEDSRKSPEMKFKSASDDNDSSASVVIKSATDKVFVNNRRVLMPKGSIQSGKGVLSENGSALSGDAIKVESTLNTANSEKDQDVNDLIFERVQEMTDIKEVKKESIDNKPDQAAVLKNNDKNLRIEIIGKRSDGGIKNGDRKPSDNNKYRNENHMKMSSTKSNIDCNIAHNPFTTIITPVLDTNTQLLNHFPPSSTHIVSSIQQQMMDPLTWPIVNPLYSNLPLQTMFGAALSSVNAVGANWMNNGLNIQAAHPITTNSNRILTKEEFYERQRRLRAEKLKHRHRDGHSRSPSGSQSPRRIHRKSKYDDDNQRRHSKKKEDSSSSKYKSKNKDNQETLPTKSSSRLVEVPKLSDIKTIDPKLMQDSIKTFLKSCEGLKLSSDQSSHKSELTTSSSDIKNIDPKLMQDSIKAYLKSREKPKLSSDNSSHKSDPPINSSDIKTIDPKLMQDSIKTFLKYLSANPNEVTVCKEEKELRKEDENNHTANQYKQTSQLTIKNGYRSGSSKKRKTTKEALLDQIDNTTDTPISEEKNTPHKTKKSRSRSVPKVSKDRLSAGGKDKEVASLPTKKSTKDIHHKRHSNHTDQTEDCSVPIKRLKKEPAVATACDGELVPVVVKEDLKKKTKKNKHHKHQSENNIDGDNDASKKRHKHKKQHKNKKTKKSKKTKRDS